MVKGGIRYTTQAQQKSVWQFKNHSQYTQKKSLDCATVKDKVREFVLPCISINGKE